jgi:predicted Zn-ribbon and HTH transcriptional regulator
MKRKTNEQFLKEVYNQVGDEYTFLEEYKNAETKIKVRHNCKKCNNYEYIVRPNDFIKSNARCPKCAGNIKRTTIDFKQEVYNLVKDEYTVLGQYNNRYAKILMRHNCTECNNHTWLVRPTNFLQGNRCPICNRYNQHNNNYHESIKKHLILEIQKKTKLLNRVPKLYEIYNHNKIYYHFGSWNNALVEAGLIRNEYKND